MSDPMRQRVVGGVRGQDLPALVEVLRSVCAVRRPVRVWELVYGMDLSAEARAVKAEANTGGSLPVGAEVRALCDLTEEDPVWALEYATRGLFSDVYTAEMQTVQTCAVEANVRDFLPLLGYRFQFEYLRVGERFETHTGVGITIFRLHRLVEVHNVGSSAPALSGNSWLIEIGAYGQGPSSIASKPAAGAAGAGNAAGGAGVGAQGGEGGTGAGDDLAASIASLPPMFRDIAATMHPLVRLIKPQVLPRCVILCGKSRFGYRPVSDALRRSFGYSPVGIDYMMSIEYEAAIHSNAAEWKSLKDELARRLEITRESFDNFERDRPVPQRPAMHHHPERSDYVPLATGIGYSLSPKAFAMTEMRHRHPDRYIKNAFAGRENTLGFHVYTDVRYEAEIDFLQRQYNDCKILWVKVDGGGHDYLPDNVTPNVAWTHDEVAVQLNEDSQSANLLVQLGLVVGV